MAADGPGEVLLQLEDVHAGYGEIEVLRGVSADVRTGEIVSIIGANGAGKSTLLRTVFGMVTPIAGPYPAGRPGDRGREPGGASCAAAAPTCRRDGATSPR